MKVTLESYGDSVSWEGDEGTSATDLLERIAGLLVSATFSYNSVIKALREAADNLELNEGN